MKAASRHYPSAGRLLLTAFCLAATSAAQAASDLGASDIVETVTVSADLGDGIGDSAAQAAEDRIAHALQSASIVQTGLGNYANIQQVGQANQATIRQTGNNQSAWISQSGSGNVAFISQSSR